MGQTKLETYIDILKILAQNGPKNCCNTATELHAGGNETNKHLNFLLKQGLVDALKEDKQKLVYSVTQRGIRVLIHFRVLKQESSLIKEVF